ncbi:PhzF family phenazine biosynthesis protein [Sphingobium lignivorans]|uniref:PhzF superfamily epimerase YddE/YHI9 n=1 Tax=Sphingobium lignivorans TaxID=2735886 RepID=A0ABR6NAH8_9SPHN|nr:PhzF family phenazine biosynthesis protein [Sphingobium lignivorans]MBB5984270.1 putative PhzF superfamily epimerase YddE/YHI9 [Sphingobium lignivorans]
MTSLPFTQVDAFADAPFTGNPAAVMPLDRWLDDSVLQAIAQENNLAETAFTVKLPADAGADYELRWFTPSVEVVLCGHATLASGHVLMPDDAEVLRFRTRRAGDLAVRRDSDGYALDLPAWPTQAAERPDIAALLGPVAPVETRWREGGYLLFLYPDEDSIRALRPDFPALARHGDVLTIATAPGIATDVVSRVFAPGAGIDEDPVTGSAHALLTAYWAPRLGRDRFTAFQASARGGHIGCCLSGDRAILTGRCRTVIEGRFIL